MTDHEANYNCSCGMKHKPCLRDFTHQLTTQDTLVFYERPERMAMTSAELMIVFEELIHHIQTTRPYLALAAGIVRVKLKEAEKWATDHNVR